MGGPPPGVTLSPINSGPPAGVKLTPIETWRKTQGGVTPTPSKAGKAFDTVAKTAINNEPAITSGLGAAGGFAIAGPVGATVGGAYGGFLGETLREGAMREKPDSEKQVKSAILGAAAGPLEEISPALGAAKRYLRPKSAENIVPFIEQAARKLTNAVNPNPAEADSFIQNSMKQVPNILEYAKKTGNPLKTRLEFSKASEGAGEEAYQHFIKNVLDPVAEKQVSVAGTGYAGKTLGEGQSATLKAINDRLGEINTQLSPAYRQRNAGVVGSKLASEPELQAEAANLRKILHTELSKSSGLTPEEVAAMRQRYGQLRHIARATNEAVTQRSLQGAKGTESGIGSVSTGAAAGKAIDVLRGKTDAIADRMFQRAIRGFPGKSEPLKSVVPPQVKAMLRSPLWKNIDIEKVEANISKLSSDEQQAVVKGMQKRLQERATAIGERKSAAELKKVTNLAAHGKNTIAEQ